MAIPVQNDIIQMVIGIIQKLETWRLGFEFSFEFDTIKQN